MAELTDDPSARTVAGMQEESEPLRLTYSEDADRAGEPDDVEQLEQWLNERLGSRWDGWHEGHSGVPGVALFAQTKENRDGRTVLTGLLLLGKAITADALRKVPVTAIENSGNLGSGGNWERMQEEKAKLPPLERRPDMSPEEFSQLVAEHFKMWAKYVPHPAAAMAAEWKVKAPTVHSWIREARLRGLLPPARRGKAKG